MSVYKNLDPEDVLISSFQVNKTFTVTNTDSGSGIYGIPIVKGTDSNLYDYSLSTAASSSFGTGSSDTPKTKTFYHVPLYNTINKLYYKDVESMRGYIDYIRGVPTASEAHPQYGTKDGVIEYNSTRELYNTATALRKPFTRQLHDSATVITVPQKLFGENISANSIRLTDDSTTSTIILEDDGRGNLYDVAYSSSYAGRAPDTTNSGSVVGNVFYNDGIIVITDTGSYSTVGRGTGTDGYSLKFDATHTIYEREYICKMPAYKLQNTTNRSLKVGMSGSYSYSSSAFGTHYNNTIHDTWAYHNSGWATGSMKLATPYEIGTEFLSVATHSNFATYVTTIGLYNDNNELLAIGKVANPVKNDKELALSFVVRFDT
jgi:hypothetical protein